MVGRENNKKALFVDLGFSWGACLLSSCPLGCGSERLHAKTKTRVFRVCAFSSVDLFYFSHICFLDLENQIGCYGLSLRDGYQIGIILLENLW